MLSRAKLGTCHRDRSVGGLSLSRREALISGAALAVSGLAVAGGSAHAASAPAASGLATEAPDLAGLLFMEPELLEEHVSEQYGFAYDSLWDVFLTSEPRSLGGFAGTGELLLLGDYDAGLDRRVASAKLRGGVRARAVVYTIHDGSAENADDEGGLEFDPAARMDVVMNVFSIGEAQVLGRHVAEAGEDAPSFLVASAKQSGRRLVWTVTFARRIGISVGCSQLEYYAESNCITDDYDVLAAQPGPWDIDIRPVPRSTKPALELGIDGCTFSNAPALSEYESESYRLLDTLYVQEWPVTPVRCRYISKPVAYAADGADATALSRVTTTQQTITRTALWESRVYQCNWDLA